MPRNEKFIQLLKAPEGHLDTTIAEATGPFMQLASKLQLNVTQLQGNPEAAGPMGLPFVSIQDMLDAGAVPAGDGADQLYIEAVIPPQTGGVDVAQTLANVRADWDRGVNQLMIDVFEDTARAATEKASRLLNIPEVRAAAAAAMKV